MDDFFFLINKFLALFCLGFSLCLNHAPDSKPFGMETSCLIIAADDDDGDNIRHNNHHKYDQVFSQQGSGAL